MARYRHWQNRGVGGDLVFVTTTVLDFVHAFDRDDVKDAMCRFLLRFCRGKGARLEAFVVMAHHVHLLLRLPAEMDVSKFVASFKRAAADTVRPMLSERKEREFDQQRGLNGNSFWQRSFRSVVVVGDKMLAQKAEYIHFNPVKAELVVEPSEYRWSSAWMFEAGLYSEEPGLRLDIEWPSVRLEPADLSLQGAYCGGEIGASATLEA